MKKIFLDETISEDITISGNNAQHLAYSLRAKRGDKIICVDTDGNCGVFELAAFDKDSVKAKLVGEIKKVNLVETIKIFQGDTEKIFTKRITLAECLPKQNKFDAIVEKATELGVSKIFPLISDRTIARPGNFRAKSKLERWQRIAKEAAEQSERDTIPKISVICEISDWLKEISPSLMKFNKAAKHKKISDDKNTILIFCYENEREISLQKVLREYKNLDCDKDIILLIGPEGGFSEREVEEIKHYGGVSVSLGRRILKTDTAALSAIAAVQYEFSC